MPYEHYNKSESARTEPIHGDTLLAYSTRCKRLMSETRALYEESHKTKHWCHYGSFPCYICPTWTALDSTSDSGIECAIYLRKKLKKEFWWNQPPNKIGKWVLRPI